MSKHEFLIEELLLRWDKHFERLLSILEKGQNSRGTATGMQITAPEEVSSEMQIEKSIPPEVATPGVTEKDLEQLERLAADKFAAAFKSAEQEALGDELDGLLVITGWNSL